MPIPGRRRPSSRLESSTALSGSALAGELAVEPWMKTPGSPFVAYGQPSRFEDKIVRIGALDQLAIKREGLRCAP